MSSISSRGSAFRIIVIGAVLINALIPVGSATVAQGTGSKPAVSSQERAGTKDISPLQNTVKYSPPNIKRPTRFDPTPDRAASPIPAKSPIGAGAHAAEEWVDLQSVEQAALIYAQTALDFCQ